MTVPPFVILYYPSNISITLKDRWTGATAGGTGTTTTFTDVVDGDTLDATIDPGTAPSTTIAITISNAWAVRGLSAAGTATVSIKPKNTPAGSTITLTGDASAGSLAINSLTATSGGSATFGLTGMTPVYGDVGMTIDMANANKSGTFAGGDGYTITVVTN
ncbi:hypothetical protein NY406_07515 [Chlorobaculum sp. MV4-Y]|uniref:hypothetical protein n=1 Tax=Chlorobaculum sp. MV4-Y TaxID=2976335 RepID=UPI0021AF37C6|nr:hypothetical protein [Chlorobaculum sp. MV4-Y]UWX57069.1 hypothetical protein NY406_07515 [Chlorobaculum sp. MV4-Y]